MAEAPEPTPAPQDPTGVDLNEVLARVQTMYGELSGAYAAATIKIEKQAAVIDELRTALVAKSECASE